MERDVRPLRVRPCRKDADEAVRLERRVGSRETPPSPPPVAFREPREPRKVRRGYRSTTARLRSSSNCCRSASSAANALVRGKRHLPAQFQRQRWSGSVLIASSRCIRFSPSWQHEHRDDRVPSISNKSNDAQHGDLAAARSLDSSVCAARSGRSSQTPTAKNQNDFCVRSVLTPCRTFARRR